MYSCIGAAKENDGGGGYWAGIQGPWAVVCMGGVSCWDGGYEKGTGTYWCVTAEPNDNEEG